MHPEPWIYFCGPNDLLARKAILETLSSNGVVTKSLDINAPSDDGIICFSGLNDDLYELVREISQNKKSACWWFLSPARGSTARRRGVFSSQAHQMSFFGHRRLKWLQKSRRGSTVGV